MKGGKTCCINLPLAEAETAFRDSQSVGSAGTCEDASGEEFQGVKATVLTKASTDGGVLPPGAQD